MEQNMQSNPVKTYVYVEDEFGKGKHMNSDPVKTYTYNGEEIGRLVRFVGGETQFQTNRSEFDAISLVCDMPLEVKVHMRHKAHAVCRVLEYYGIDPNSYLDNEDILIYVANKGYKSLTALYRGDNRAWKLVKQRGLEDELFQSFQPE
tara:strand:+ start:158 stop:601 length:444 start_codon:yes stop_codon:yes gene_type:complete